MKAENIQIKYGDKIVVDNLSFDIGAEEILGILGKNGTGKTTLLSAIVGLKSVSKGRILLSDDEKNIGFSPDNSESYEYLTGKEFLTVLSDLKNFSKKDLEELIKWISNFITLPDLNLPLSILSKGNLEKIIFIQSFINYPKILILDEPFSGFDTESVVGAKKVLLEYSKKGNSIILSTHILEMCAQICNKVIILDDIGGETIIFNEKSTLEEKIELLENRIVGEIIVSYP